VGGLNPSTPISKVTNFLPFCTIGISWSVSDRQTDDRWITLFTPGYCAYATLRQSVANLMFRNVSFNFATAISKFDTFSSYHIVSTQIARVTNLLPFCTIGVSMYQKHILPYFIIPSTFSPQASSPLERYRQTDRRTDGQHSSPPVT